MSLRRLFRHFFPRRKHPLLDAEITAAPRDAELRARYQAAVTGEHDAFVTQRFEEGLRWREVLKAFAGGHASGRLKAGPNVSRVLDVGAGNGAIELAFAGDPATFAVSVDALWNDTARSLGVRRVIADASALPFRNGSFDTILCLETIEHVPAPRTVAREIERVAARAAAVLVTTPAKWRYVLGPDPHFGIRYLTLFPPAQQRRLAARRGFNGPHHFVDRIYASTGQLRRVFAELTLEATLARGRMPQRWFWDALIFRKSA